MTAIVEWFPPLKWALNFLGGAWRWVQGKKAGKPAVFVQDLLSGHPNLWTSGGKWEGRPALSLSAFFKVTNRGDLPFYVTSVSAALRGSTLRHVSVMTRASGLTVFGGNPVEPRETTDLLVNLVFEPPPKLRPGEPRLETLEFRDSLGHRNRVKKVFFRPAEP